MEIDLSTDTAPSPERTLQLAETFAEVARCSEPPDPPP